MESSHIASKDEVFDHFLLSSYMRDTHRAFKNKIRRERPDTDHRKLWKLQIELARHIYSHKGKTPADAIEWLLETCLPEALERDIDFAEGTRNSFLQEIRDFQRRLGRGEHLVLEAKLTGQALRNKVEQLHREATTLKKKKKVACKITKLCRQDHSPELNGLWSSFWMQDISSTLPSSMNDYTEKQMRNAYRETLSDLTKDGIENGIKIAVKQDYDIALETLLTQLQMVYRNSNWLTQAEIPLLSAVLMNAIRKEMVGTIKSILTKFPDLDIDIVHLVEAIDTGNVDFINMLLEYRKESTIKLIRSSSDARTRAIGNKDLNALKFLLSKGARLYPYYNESVLERLAGPQCRKIMFTNINVLGSVGRYIDYYRDAQSEYATFSEQVERIPDGSLSEFCQHMINLHSGFHSFNEYIQDRASFEQQMKRLRRLSKPGDVFDIQLFANQDSEKYRYMYVHLVDDALHVAKCPTKCGNTYLPRCALPSLAYHNVRTSMDLDSLYPHIENLEGVMIHCADLDHHQLKMLREGQALHVIMLGDGMWISRVKLGDKDAYPIEFASYTTKEGKKWTTHIWGEKSYSVIGETLTRLLN